MKAFIYYFLFLMFFVTVAFSQSQSDSTSTYQNAVWDTVSVGDINMDGIEDSAFVYTPPIVDVATCLNDTCYNLIKFSCKLPDLIIPESIYCNVQNAGHLSASKTSELIVIPDWFQSCWGNAQVYSLRNGKWKRIAFVGIYKCLEDDNNSRIKKQNGKYYLIGEKMNIKTGNIQRYKKKINFK